jgi:hypothetical protein
MVLLSLDVVKAQDVDGVATFDLCCAPGSLERAFSDFAVEISAQLVVIGVKK